MYHEKKDKNEVGNSALQSASSKEQLDIWIAENEYFQTETHISKYRY